MSRMVQAILLISKVGVHDRLITRTHFARWTPF
jgi:hypothetical protein